MLRRYIAIFVCAWLSLSAGTAAHPRVASAGVRGVSGQPTLQTARRLEEGETIEQHIEKGEKYSYLIGAQANQYLRIKVEQNGRDLALRIYSPGGQVVAEVTRLTTGTSYKPISTIATLAGDYRLEVSAERADFAGATYEVSIEQRRTATVDDHKRNTADRLFVEAELLRIKDSRETSLTAVARYEEAASLYNSIGDKWGESNASMNMGIVRAALSEYQKALDAFNRALPIFQDMNDRISQAEALNNIAFAYYATGDTQKAIENCLQSRAIYKEIGDRKREGEAISNIGSLLLRTGETRGAVTYFDQALAVARETGNKPYETSILTRLGAAYDDLGEPRQALESYRFALALMSESRDKHDQASTLVNVAMLYRNGGDPDKAIENLKLALTAFREAGDRLKEARALNGLGLVYADLGEVDAAYEYYTQALAISTEINDRSGQLSSLGNVSTIELTLGDLPGALDNAGKALELARTTRDRQSEGRILVKIGNTCERLGNWQQAFENYTNALTMLETLADKRWQAFALLGLGSVLQQRGDKETALRQFERALSIEDDLGELPARADVLYRIAIVKRDLGRLDEARAAIESGIDAVESVRGRVSDLNLQAVYLASKRDFYDLQIDLLMQAHHADASRGLDGIALQAAERSRARSLLDTLTEGRVKITQGADQTLVERRALLQQLINAKDQYRMRLLGRNHTAAQVAAVEKEETTLVADLREATARIRTSTPRYAALIQPALLGVKEIQQNILDPQTVLLEYSLGELRSYLWAVTTNSITSFVLPSRAEINAAAKNFYQLITARNIEVAGETAVERLARVKTADEKAQVEVGKLSRMIIGPARHLLQGKRLAIVGDGALQYLPFGALTTQTEQSLNNGASGAPDRGRDAEVPLVVDHEIVCLPSASILGSLREVRGNLNSPGKAVAVFADPVFSQEDSRVSETQARAAAPARSAELSARATAPKSLVRATREAGLKTFRRLRFSRQEADEIGGLVSSNQRLAATDFAASKLAVLNTNLAEFKLLHFATHTLLNSNTPELSGIVLSLVDANGTAQDGFLRLHEIYNLRLAADLVVLSACQTALGKDIKGEGLIGLTRGFMYAGTSRVVASLWSVDDRATSELMKRFYRSMLIDGLRPAAALRAAQIDLLKDRGWRTPYYWAAFTLQGEWR